MFSSLATYHCLRVEEMHPVALASCCKQGGPGELKP